MAPAVPALVKVPCTTRLKLHFDVAVAAWAEALDKDEAKRREVSTIILPT